MAAPQIAATAGVFGKGSFIQKYSDVLIAVAIVIIVDIAFDKIEHIARANLVAAAAADAFLGVDVSDEFWGPDGATECQASNVFHCDSSLLVGG